jgi:Arc/MetJ-type ribon-helix-helix transcriptional regulator
MRLVSVKMPEALIEAMDELVKRGLYPSRSAVLRTAVRDLLKKELWSIIERIEEAKQATETY